MTILSTFRSLLKMVFRGPPQEEEFDPDNPAAQATGTATAQVNPIVGVRALELEGRRLRYDVLRLTLDRNTLVLKQKERLRGIPGNALNDVTRGALLMDED